MASPLTELLGDKVATKDGSGVDVNSFQGEGKVLGLYFSAHWCPPCRSFTPQLAEWYNNLQQTKDKKFDIVFISSDRDQKSFDEYIGEMPWKVLPFEDRQTKNKLASKFKVTGIPTLIMLNGEDGSVIRTDGRTIVAEDKDGGDFPWFPKPVEEILRDGKLVSGKDSTTTFDNSVKGKVFGLYFSAHWCGPCRSFTPQLIKTYNQLKKDGKDFEIIFVSSDRKEDSFDEYFGTMPWLALPFNDPRCKKLSQRFEVSGIPTLVILEWKDGKASVITNNGRGAVSGDPEGKEFPWFPKTVNELNGQVAGDLNQEASLIWFTDKDSKEKTIEILEEVAGDYVERNKGKEGLLKFFYAAEGDDDDDISQSLRNFARLPKQNPLLVILNIPDQEIYSEDQKTFEGVDWKEKAKSLIQKFEKKELKMNPLRPSDE